MLAGALIRYIERVLGIDIKEIEKNYNKRLLNYRNARIQQEQTENDLRELLNILDRVPFTVDIIENNDVFKLIKEKYKK